MIDGIKRKSRIFVGDSIVRKTDSRLNKGDDGVVCLPGVRIEHVAERIEKVMGAGKGVSILVHVGTNNADREGTMDIVKKYRNLPKRTKQARVGQIILSGILPVIADRNQGYRNSRMMAINRLVQQLCKEEDVGFMDLGSSFVAKEELNIMAHDSDPHIICTEYRANNDITGGELEREGYVMFQKDRMGRRGRSIIIRQRYYTSIQLRKEADCEEAIWCTLVSGHNGAN